MQKWIPFSDITACGVWHKGKNTLSSLDEAVQTLGENCTIINGGFFNAQNGTPSSAYSINGADYHTGGNQFGFAFTDEPVMRWSYLRGNASGFVGAYPMYISNGTIIGTGDGQSTSRTILGAA